MRKHIILFALSAIVLTLTSACVAAFHTLYPLPYGKWKNVEFGLILKV